MGHDEKPEIIGRFGLIVLKQNIDQVTVPAGELGTLKMSGSTLYVDDGSAWVAV